MKLAWTQLAVVVLAMACGGGSSSGGAAGIGGGAGAASLGGAGVASGASGSSGSAGIGSAGATAVGNAGQGGFAAIDAGTDASVPDCTGAPAGPGPATSVNRYAGLTEAQMFSVTQDALCATVMRCPALVGEDPSATIDLPTCQMQLDDMTNYGSEIDDSRRASLDTCVDDIERASCCYLVDNDFPPSCASVEDLVDLK